MFRKFGKKGFILFWYSHITNIDQTKTFAYTFNLDIGNHLKFSIRWDKRKVS